MKAASIHEIKQELNQLKPAGIIDLSLRLARFKKENKELLTYLLFEAQDEDSFVRSVCVEIDSLFEEVNLSHLYFAKKTLRKIGRVINKYARYSSVKETEISLRLYFCQKLKDSGIPIKRNPVIHNLYLAQLKKMSMVISSLHEDLQYDFQKQVDTIAEI
jgi:hypothetical protein